MHRCVDIHLSHLISTFSSPSLQLHPPPLLTDRVRVRGKGINECIFIPFSTIIPSCSQLVSFTKQFTTELRRQELVDVQKSPLKVAMSWDYVNFRRSRGCGNKRDKMWNSAAIIYCRALRIHFVKHVPFWPCICLITLTICHQEITCSACNTSLPSTYPVSRDAQIQLWFLILVQLWPANTDFS